MLIGYKGNRKEGSKGMREGGKEIEKKEGRKSGREGGRVRKVRFLFL